MQEDGPVRGDDNAGGDAGSGVTDLLDGVRALRLTLLADLTAAAGALDDDATAVAADILAADSAAVCALLP